MKKLFSLILLFTASVFGVYGQNNMSAQSILDKAKAKVQASKGINISFSLTQKDKQNKQLLSSKGTLLIKGPRYYLKQESNEIFCNGEQVWNYDGQSEVTVTKVEAGDDELSPQQIITGFNNKDFDIKLVSSTGTNYLLQLTPVDKRKNFTRVELTVNKSSNLRTKAAITDKANTVTEIGFNNIALNATIPDSRFVFDPSKHPGVEVVNQ